MQVSEMGFIRSLLKRLLKLNVVKRGFFLKTYGSPRGYYECGLSRNMAGVFVAKVSCVP